MSEVSSQTLLNLLTIWARPWLVTPQKISARFRLRRLAGACAVPIVRRNAIEFGPFLCASLFCAGAEEIHCAAGHPEKERARSRCLQMLLLGLRALNGVNSVGKGHTKARQYPWAALKIKKLGMARWGHS